MDASNRDHGDEEITEIVYELNDYCTCTKWNDETESEEMDEQGNPVPATWCSGCWQDTMSNIDYDMLAHWNRDNGIESTDKLYIGGDGIGWQRRSGYTIAEPNIEDIVKRLSIDGDFTLYFKYDGKDLTVRRTSHDEPMGTGWMTFRLATEEEIEFWENR